MADASSYGGPAPRWQVGIGMQRIFKAIELWASESDDRSRLLIIFVWIAFGILVLLSILTTAWIMVPHLFRMS